MNETAERHHQLGMMLGRQKRFREAIVAFTEALRHDPDNIQILFTRGTAFYAEKQYNESIVDYATILEMDPRHVKALVGRAFARAGKATALTERFNREGGVHYSLTFEQACMPFDKLLRSLSPEKAAYFQTKRTLDDLTVGVRQDVENALRLDPTNQGARELLRFVQRSEKDSLHSIDELIFELRKSIDEKKLAVFCGAGISFNSGLPLAMDLIGEILIKLDIPADERENTILKSDLPFESFIETLRENSNVDKIFDIFNLGEPNIDHVFLAKLAKAKYLKTICTTNFDQLIEKALEKEELKRGIDFEVYYKEDDFDKVDWNNSKIIVLKLHGSIEDRENMAITLKQVTNGDLSTQRQRIIEHIFSNGNHEYVLVLGYSCSDLFDVSPAIEAIQNNYKKVIFIKYDENSASVTQIEDENKKNPFKKFIGSKWVLYDTDKLIKNLWEFYFPETQFPKSAHNNEKWKEYVNSWYSENDLIYGSLLKYSISGDILFKISEYRKSLRYCQWALSVSKKMGIKKFEAECFDNLGSVHAVLGQNHEAIEFFKQAYTIAMQINDVEDAVNSLGNIGVAYFNLGEYYDAIKFQEQALSFAKQIGDKERTQTWLGNLGNIYMSLGEYHKAVDYYEQAANIAKQIGEKRDEGLGYGNMGMAYLCLHKYNEALKYFELSLTIAQQIGDKHSEGVRLGNLGNTYLYLGECDKAIKNFDQALRFAEHSGDKYGEVGGLSNLGTAYGRLGKYTEAIDSFKRSLTIAQQIGDQYSEGIAFSNLGNIHNFLTKFSTAIEYYNRALAILIPMLGDENPQVKQIKSNMDIARAKGKI